MSEDNTQSSIQFEVTLHVDIQFAWNCLIHKTREWWLKDFYTSEKTKLFRIDPRIGGKMYEDFGNGEGLVWADVIGIDSPNSIQFRGNLTAEFGGPAISFKKLSLKSAGDKTILSVSDTLFGVINESTASQIESGWRMIYAEAFKKYVESKVEVQ